ncbi:MAG: V-type ATPase subunit [Candidatus Thiodiazotropha sp.]|jgi:V/A-type H+/Na+-transporting ATPase subunit C
MSSTRDQAYLRTRVGVFAGRLLSPEDTARYKGMTLNQLGETFDLLPILEEPMELPQKSRLLEHALLTRIMNEFSVLLRPLSGRTRGLLLYWPRKYELYNLKTLIRGKLNGLGLEEIRDNLHDLPEGIRLPHESLLQAENVLEMLRQLEQGPYAIIARQARHVYEEKNEGFSLDAAIDRLYYTGMMRHLNMANSSDKHGARKLIGVMIDRQNILWLTRYRLVYRFSSSEAYYLLIPSGGQIQRTSLMTLANLDSLEAIIDQLPSPFREQLTNVQNITQVRQRLDQIVGLEMRKLMRHSPDAVMSALGYLIARDIDLRRLYAIIQGKILNLEPDLIDTAIPDDPLTMGTEARA